MKFKLNYENIENINTLELVHKTCVDAVKKGNKVDIVIRSK